MSKIKSQSTPVQLPQQLERSITQSGPQQVESLTSVSPVQVNQFTDAGASQASAKQDVELLMNQSRPAMAGSRLLSLMGGQSTQEAQSLFGLIPGNAGNAVSLDTLLANIPRTPEGEQTVRGLIDSFQSKTGIAVEPAMVEAILAKPERFTNLLKLSPAELSRGIDALNVHHRARGGGAEEELRVTPRLPQNFDIANMQDVDFPRPEGELNDVGAGLLRGSEKSDISDAQAKNNIVTANVLDRLAANTQAADGETFSVSYNGQSHESIDSFLGALKADGHEIEVKVKQRVANFSDLKTQLPDGTVVDVPAPLFVSTGFKDENGEEASVPAIHSELVISIRKGDETEGPGFDADLKWFQGISGTGFFPANLMQGVEWAGDQERPLGSGAEAIEAIQMAGLMSDSVSDAAAEQGLWLGGYGMTGVCNDSVAVIEHAMSGRNLTYPLLMRDDTLSPEIQERIAEGGPNAARYERILESIQTLPSDVVTNDTTRLRAANSIPWTSGNESFHSTVDARRILSE